MDPPVRDPKRACENSRTPFLVWEFPHVREWTCRHPLFGAFLNGIMHVRE